MLGWKAALDAYRRRSLSDRERGARLPVLFVLCSEDHTGGAVVAACEPAVVLQLLGGAVAPGDAAVRGALEHAIRREGVRTVVLCGHTGCVAARGRNDRRAAIEAVVAQGRALVDDEIVGGLFRKHGVNVRALCFDGPEGDVFACDLDSGRAALMGDEDFGAMVTTFGAESSAS